jgi:GAF domain-containing protein
MDQPAGRDAPGPAEEIIAAQAEEIRRLRQQLGDNQFADELRQSLSLAGASSAMTAPETHARLLTLILEMASRVISSATASISLVDQVTQELVIQQAVGPGADEAEGLRFPLGHGVAGLVAASGQPMAISNARSDARHAGEIAERTGYQPDTILCVPMVNDERIIGVMQVMDKSGGRSFSTSDIETLGLFAEQAALAIEQTQMEERLTALIGQVLAAPGRENDAAAAQTAARGFAAALQDESSYREMLDLAQLVQQIAGYGEQERLLCASLLQSLLSYLAARPRQTLSPGIW